MPLSPLSRLAGPFGLTAGALIIGGQAVMFPYDPQDHVATSTATAFQIGGVIYLAGFVALLLFAVASHGWHEQRSGTLGVVGTIAALVGTFMLGGDLWFETFAVPWLGDQAPGALSTDPTILLALGAISSYVLFAVGWFLYGVAAFRARVFPRPIAVMIAVSGLLGYSALLSPWAVPLGVSVLSLGVWMVRPHPSAAARLQPAATGSRG